jgi:hypothetical protein
MMIEGYLALALLFLLGIILVVGWADRQYQNARREQRLRNLADQPSYL